MSHSISFSVLLLSFVALNGVLAQVPFPGNCPSVQIMNTFDLDAYMGIWFEHSKYPFAFEVGKKCIYATYGNIDNSTVSVVNSAINRLTNQPTSVTGTAKVIAPAQLAVSFYPNQNSNEPNYLVLGTDYDSYSVVYSCTNLFALSHLRSVWILTREREPSSEIIDIAHKILDDNKISRAVLIDTLQRNCPAVNSNGSNSGSEVDSDVIALHEAIEKA